jgi:inhibitor of KinA
MVAAMHYPTPDWPIYLPLADIGLLVEFGDSVDPATNGRVIAFDAAVHAARLPGVLETVPSYATLMINYDPVATDFDTLRAAVAPLAAAARAANTTPAEHIIPVCYEGDNAPDLAEVAARLGMSTEAVIAAHLAGEYRVYMYGFAPGYAYLGGVPAALELPRKAVPVRGRPVGSVMIAGGQCLVTTLPMPTGWWVIGRSPVAILRPEAPRPFLFEPGDRIRFTRIARFDAR